jgi:hypothetical protein
VVLAFYKCKFVLGLPELIIATAADTPHNVLVGPATDDIPLIFL